jgi:hypothetical protein
MASSFEHISAACARALARHAAIRLAKDELARQGLRVASVAMRDIALRADAILAARPELVAQAAQRVAACPEKWLPKRALAAATKLQPDAGNAHE